MKYLDLLFVKVDRKGLKTKSPRLFLEGLVNDIVKEGEYSHNRFVEAFDIFAEFVRLDVIIDLAG
ncbi:MAG: hypothetical protein LBI53_01065 [Candidatus Peribacteria bacterium]|nr:hypothetical protein [Candidatus Peribacteria bacterium]